MASKFGIKTADVDRVRQASGLSLDELAPVFSASYRSRTSADTIWKLRREGLGWGEVAHRIGMHPGTFNKLRRSGAFDSDRIWSSALGSRFGVSEDSIRAIQRRGASPKDCVGAVMIAKASRRSPQTVYDEYRRVWSWESMRSKHKVDFDNWRQYAKNSGSGNSSVHAKSKGKDKPPTKPNGKGQAQGQGKPGGHGQSGA